MPGQESDADDTGKRGTMQSLGKHQSLISPALQFSPEISLSRPKVTKLDERDLAASSITAANCGALKVQSRSHGGIGPSYMGSAGTFSGGESFFS